MDQLNYARWLSVHVRDMQQLATKHPDIYREFQKGNFTVRKTMNPFSSMAIDQAHEQANAVIKGDGGAIGLKETQTELKTIFCRYCGYENENDAIFCQQCGKNVSPKAILKISESTEFTPKYLQCFVCGAKNRSSAKFCKKCGNLIE